MPVEGSPFSYTLIIYSVPPFLGQRCKQESEVVSQLSSGTVLTCEIVTKSPYLLPF